MRTPEYSRLVGGRLRALRTQQRLSLMEVEETTEGEFKASVLGAYERGERAISVPRLHSLASFYGVPVDQLLPKPKPTNPYDELLDATRFKGSGPMVTVNRASLSNLLAALSRV